LLLGESSLLSGEEDNVDFDTLPMTEIMVSVVSKTLARQSCIGLYWILEQLVVWVQRQQWKELV